MAAEQTLPAQAHSQRVGAQKIFVAEARVFCKRHRLSFESGAAPEAKIVFADFDLTPENTLQPPRNSLLQAGVSDQQRNSDIGEPEKNQ